MSSARSTALYCITSLVELKPLACLGVYEIQEGVCF